MSSTSYAAPAAERVLEMLELFAETDSGLTLAAISRQLGISMNSTFRICRVLETHGYLQREEITGVFRLTSKLYTLGARVASRITVLAQARPALEWLTTRTGENAHLCVLRDAQLVLLDQVVSPHPVRVVVETGTLLSPHASAFGKVILANLPTDRQQQYCAQTWPQLTPFTRIDSQQMSAEWGEIRKSGVGYDFEEHQIGVRCIGAPVFGQSGEVVAGLGVMGPSYRLTPEVLTAYASDVAQAARYTSMALGAPGISATLPVNEEVCDEYV